MRSTKSVTLALLSLFAAPSTVWASPFGIASAYNIFAIGSSSIAGTIAASSDVGGRVAASSAILNVSQVGLHGPVNDPYGSLTNFSFVSPGGYTGQSVNITGNAYAPGASSSKFGFTGGGSLSSTGPSPIDFNALRGTIDAQSLALAALASTGTVQLNGNDLVLTGLSNTTNIFYVTAAQLASATDMISIHAPAGSTVIVNVSGGSGSTVQVGKLFYNGNQTSGDSTADDDILFNFYQANRAVNLNGQFSASILAPLATITGNQQLDGTVIAAAFNDSGEIHNVEFTGSLPTPTITPEPSSFVLLSTGVLGVLGAVRRRRSA